MSIRIVNRIFLAWLLLGLFCSAWINPAQQTAFGSWAFWLILAPCSSFLIFNLSRLIELSSFLLARR
jgi:hypothetical protein